MGKKVLKIIWIVLISLVVIAMVGLSIAPGGLGY